MRGARAGGGCILVRLLTPTAVGADTVRCKEPRGGRAGGGVFLLLAAVPELGLTIDLTATPTLQNMPVLAERMNTELPAVTVLLGLAAFTSVNCSAKLLPSPPGLG